MNQVSHSTENMNSIFSGKQAQTNINYLYPTKDVEHDMKCIEITISERKYISVNESFMEMVRNIVENNLDNSEFNLVLFASEMNISVSTLARRFKKYMNISPNKFITKIRLMHAELMLKSNSGNNRNIAHKVGFQDSKYFSRCFRAEFGITPNEIRKRIK
jgi:AraC-like DNA-binding protein